MQHYVDSVLDRHGNAVVGASVTVRTYPAGALASLFSDDGVTPMANPATTDNNGMFSFYVADGHYNLVVSGPTIATTTITDVLIEDPANPSSISVSSLFLPSFALGSILFIGAAGAVSEDNANFRWDDTNNQLLLGAGSAAAPAYTFAGTPNLGMYNAGSSIIGWSSGGTRQMSLSGQGLFVDNDFLAIRNLAGGQSGAILTGEGTTHVLAQRNGTNAQSFRIYNTFTDAANYERLQIEATGVKFRLLATMGGSGVSRPLSFGVGGTDIWQVSTSGHFIAEADNVRDIGAVGATRPRSVYIGTSIGVNGDPGSTYAAYFNRVFAQTSGSVFGVRGIVQLTPPSATTAGGTGVLGFATIGDANAFYANASLIGTQGSVRLDNGTALGTASGGWFSVHANHASASITTAYGVFVDASSVYLGSYTNLYGIWVGDQKAAATLTAGISLNVSSGTNKWNIFAVGTAINFMQGRLDLASGLSSNGANDLSFYTNNGAQKQVTVRHVASATNYIQLAGASTGNTPIFEVAGSVDSNINAIFVTKGSGSHIFQTNSAAPVTQFKVLHTASAVNFLEVRGNTTNNGPIISAQGETNVDLLFYSNGSGSLQFRTAAGASNQLAVLHTASANRNITITGSNGGAPKIGTSAGDLALSAGGSDQVVVVAVASTTRTLTLSGSNGGNPTISTSAGDLAITPATRHADAITTSHATAGLGYATGAGGTVVQATNKSTGVTLNKVTGEITMNGAALAADTTVSFTLTNSAIAAGDDVMVHHVSGGTVGSYTATALAAGGSATVTVRNITTGSLSEAIVLKYTVIKSVTA